MTLAESELTALEVDVRACALALRALKTRAARVSARIQGAAQEVALAAPDVLPDAKEAQVERLSSVDALDVDGVTGAIDQVQQFAASVRTLRSDAAACRS